MANKDVEKTPVVKEEKIETVKEPVKKTSVETKIFEKKDSSYEERKLEAAAAQAVKTAASANAELALRESERIYAQEKRTHMLTRCKSEPVVTITPSKMYANIFGSTYSFYYNGIPVTVKFDGTPQQFPRFIANKIQEKILKTADANTPKDETVELS